MSAWWPRAATKKAGRSPPGGRVAERRRQEHRHDHRDVRQVGAAVVGGVEHVDVAGPDAAPSRLAAPLQHRADRSRPWSPGAPACAGRWRSGAPSASNRAQEKSSRSLMLTECGGGLQRHAHLLGDRHEQAVEHLEQHRIDVDAGGLARPAAASTRSSTRFSRASTRARQPGSTTVVAVASTITAGPVTCAPAPSRSRSNTGASTSRPAKRTRVVSTGSARAGGDAGGLGRTAGGRGAHGLGGQRLHHQRPLGRDEAEAAAVLVLEGRAHGRKRSERDLQRRVGPGVAQLGAGQHLHRAQRRALGPQRGLGLFGQRRRRSARSPPSAESSASTPASRSTLRSASPMP